MKLCTIISEIDKSVNLELTAIALRNKGFEQHFILINCKGGSFVSFLTENNFDFEEIEASKISQSLPQIRKCKRILKRLKPDIVHCHLAHANWIGLWASKLAGISMRIYTRHSGKPLVFSKKEWIIDKIQNKLSTHIISISRNISDLLIEQGVSEKKISLIHHGFDLDSFENVDEKIKVQLQSTYNPNQKYPVIGVNARWMKWKGVHHIITAFNQYLQHEPNALLCLFGASDNADYSSEIKQQLKQLPDESINVVAFEKNVFALYQLFDFYIHVPVNSTCEAFGQTYIESLAAGIPSIFTLSGIAQEFVIDGKNALVVPFEDPNAIVNALLRFNENPELNDQLIQQGRKDTRLLFSFENYISNLSNLYRS